MVILFFKFLVETMSSSSSSRHSSPDTATPAMEESNADDAQQFQQIIRDRRCKCSTFGEKGISRLLLSFIIGHCLLIDAIIVL